MDKIFIQIASYRDPQCGPTVDDLIRKAEHPERISFGICLQWQFDNQEEEATCGPSSLPNWPTIRLCIANANTSRGTCWARSKCQQLWKNEKFTLQIDSHMRAERRWDTQIISCWEKTRNSKAIISCYPNGFILDGPQNAVRYNRTLLPIMAAKEFDPEGILRLQGISKYAVPGELPILPPQGAFVSAGMLFAPASTIEDTPYDPLLYFYGEESTYAARLWTAGYDLYNPDRLLLYHLYKGPSHSTATHWGDHANWSELNKASIQRALKLFNQTDDPGAYRLGSLRSLKDYCEWSGIDFSRKKIQPHALQGMFGKSAPKDQNYYK